MKRFTDDTIVAPATIAGTGAISLVRISGPEAFPIADAVVELSSGKISESKGYTVHYGQVFSAPGQLLDEVMVSVFRAPHSYTGEDSVEISCHASSYIVSELLRMLTDHGARTAYPGEFTQRAFLNGKMDLSQAEAVADVISSTTRASHRVSIGQLRGGISKELSALRARLLDMCSLLELELDFSDEEVTFAPREQLLEMIGECTEKIDSLRRTFKLGNAIKRGVPVAIVGPPNAGKSTLLNLLLGEERAIVSSVAGTTRDTVEETMVLGGVLFRFIDTAGIRESSEEVESLGIERTFRKISEAEIVISVLDATSDESDLLHNLETVVSHVDTAVQKLIILVNKSEKVREEVVNKNVNIINKFVLFADNRPFVLKFSAKTGFGLETLHEELISLCAPILSDEDSTFITNSRHYEALTGAVTHLSAAAQSLRSGTVPSDLIAEDLRLVLTDLGAITGEGLITPDEILGNIFRNFCIGK